MLRKTSGMEVYPEKSPQANFLLDCWWREGEILLRKTQAWKSIQNNGPIE
ncbi:MAG: hypothetical protein ACYCVB_01355 [Bacilli bacterium]